MRVYFSQMRNISTSSPRCIILILGIEDICNKYCNEFYRFSEKNIIINN